MLYLCGGLAFLLLFLGDWNDWKGKRPALRLCFPIGCTLLGAVTALQAARGTTTCPPAARAAFFALACLFLLLLVYTLFFALPVREAYVDQPLRRPACTSGVYALCRHPGVLWFVGLYLCLVPAMGLPLGAAVFYSGCNLTLVVFEDLCVFPTRLADYEDYRRTTPFLLPTPRSIRTCRRAG